MSKRKTQFLLSIVMVSLLSASMYSISTANKSNVPTTQSNEPKASSGWFNLSSSFTSAIPDVNINFTKGGSTRTFTMEQIVNYTSYENQTFPLVSYTIEKNGPVEIIGFNPIYLMEITGWTDIFNFTVTAKDDHTSIVNITQLLLADGEYVKHTDTENETIIIITWGDQWLADYKDSYGDFYLWGENLEGSQKVKNISTVAYTDPWTVNIIVNGTEEVVLNSLNGTSATVGNYSTYNWGYFDTNAGYGWDARDCTGFTIASLLQHTSLGEQNYTISFIAYDGYGAKKVFTKSQIENGFTGFMFDDPQKEMINEGKQAMLMEKQDGDALGYRKGPYQVVFPGTDKASYIGGIVEIRITIIESTETESTSGIPGYSFGIIIASFAVVITMVVKKRK